MARPIRLLPQGTVVVALSRRHLRLRSLGHRVLATFRRRVSSRSTKRALSAARAPPPALSSPGWFTRCLPRDGEITLSGPGPRQSLRLGRTRAISAAQTAALLTSHDLTMASVTGRCRSRGAGFPVADSGYQMCLSTEN